MQVPAAAQDKSIYVIKKRAGRIHGENYTDLLLFGVLSPSPLLQLWSTMEQVMVEPPPNARLLSAVFVMPAYYLPYRVLGEWILCPSPGVCSAAVKPQKPRDVAKPHVWRHCSARWEHVPQDIYRTGAGSRENRPPCPDWGRLDRKLMQHLQNVIKYNRSLFLFFVWFTHWLIEVRIKIVTNTLNIFTLRDDDHGRALSHVIETLVISWTSLIQKVLKEDSSDQLMMGCNPGPSAELRFWTCRKSNIQNIYHQVSSPFLVFSKIIHSYSFFSCQSIL